MTGSLLLDTIPGLADVVEPVSLGMWPTPIDRLEFDDRSAIFAKRDDLSARPGEYGGNKVRNLEWILGLARKRGQKTLLTCGARGSHWIRAITDYGEQLGFQVRATLYPQVMGPHDVETLETIQSSDARWSMTYGYWDVPAHVLMHSVAATVQGDGPVGYIPAGGASGVGCLGYVQAGLEIGKQVDEGLLPVPRFIYCPAGSCGTVVGLTEGIALAGLEQTRVVGVRVVPKIVTGKRRLTRLRKELRELLARGGATGVKPELPEILHAHAGKGYAHPTDEAREVARRVQEQTGLVLDDTYSAKAFAGMLAHREASGVKDEPVLFINTFDGRG